MSKAPDDVIKAAEEIASIYSDVDASWEALKHAAIEAILAERARSDRLLKAYVEHVLYAEGTDFLPVDEFDGVPPEDVARLNAMAWRVGD